MAERENKKFERNLGKSNDLRDNRVRNAVELRKNAQDERLKKGRPVAYSNILINNTDIPPTDIPECHNDYIQRVIAGVPDITCEPDADPRLAESLEARGTDVSEEAVQSDDTPSSEGTNIGKELSAFRLITDIKTQVIAPCNVDIGHFRKIQLMIHSLFYFGDNTIPVDPTIFPVNHGFVGFTPVGLLSEYTATIYYAATDSFTHYQNIIKIILSVMDTMQPLAQALSVGGIVCAFKLDRGVKPGDTIKLILSLTFGREVGANVILIPVLNIVGFNLSSMDGDGVQLNLVNGIGYFTRHYHLAEYNLLGLTPRGLFSIFDLIARIRLYANQEAFGALIEPTDDEKSLMQSFFARINGNGLVAFIQFIKFAFYTDARINHQDKNFAFFLNIFFNFFKVSMNAADPMASRSTAKIMYTDFFSNYNNYGSIIRIFNNMMSFPLLNQRAIMFLSGSNAARAYKLIEDILTKPEIERGQIYDTHMATLSDNDFMFYLLNEGSEEYRLAIRMMLGACLYYLKYILNDAERGQYTNLLEESISIVGHDDHLFAQRLNANAVFLERCFNTSMSYTDATTNTIQNVTISNILQLSNVGPEFNFYEKLSGNVTLAFLDVVFKHNTAEKWYISVFSIFGITCNPLGTTIFNIYEVTPVSAERGTYNFQYGAQQSCTAEKMQEVLTFLTTKAMAVNCIATPWTLILNILYTIFVTENCVARIVVGKLGNDPKNLEKYFSILNTHLNYLLEQYDGIPYMLEKITTTVTLQTYIIHQSQLCQRPETPDNPPISTRYETLKSLCTVWVQKMFILALEPATRELFFLSAAYTFTRRQATPLEKGICCAWTLNGNICNKLEFLQNFNPDTIFTSAIMPNAMYLHGVPANFQPVYIWERMSESEQRKMSASERGMHDIVPRLQQIVYGAIDTSKAPGFNVTPNPQLVGQEPQVNHYAYMNYLWKHLTKRSIDLRSMFKSNVKDLKRIVGSKNFTAISLAGAYPCILLIDELLESNNTDNPRALTVEKTSDETLNCRRGLLPLLVPDTNSTLFARMVAELLYEDYIIYIRNYTADVAAVAHVNAAASIYSTNNILIFLGFLFSIKIKSSASIGPRNMLSLVDSIINFRNIPDESKQLLTYTGTEHGPVAAGTCSLAPLSLNPDTDACATGGVVGHRGGAPKPAVSSAAKKVDAAAAPIATGVSTEVSKPDSKGKKPLPTEKLTKSQQNLQQHTIHTKKKDDAVAAPKAAAHNKSLYPLLNPELGPFKIFMDQIKEVFASGFVAGTYVIPANSIPFNPKTCVSGITRQEVFNFDSFYNRDPYAGLPISVGGSNKKTKTNNKLSKTNNHTRRNKNKRKKNSKSKTKTKFKTKSSPKHRKAIPSSRSGSQSNRKKSKPKKSQKNVTFKRRRARK